MMAVFKNEISYDELELISEEQASYMFAEMVESSAKLVKDAVENNMRKAFKDYTLLAKGLKITKIYKTPSDDGTNCKVAFYGYGKNAAGKKVSIPLVANAREYGTFVKGKPHEKKVPFFRKSFNKAKIENNMQEIQKKYIKEN